MCGGAIKAERNYNSQLAKHLHQPTSKQLATGNLQRAAGGEWRELDFRRWQAATSFLCQREKWFMEEARDSCWLGGSVARISGWFGMQPAVWLAFWPKRLDAGQTINFESCLNRRGAERRTSTFYFFIFLSLWLLHWKLLFVVVVVGCLHQLPAACCWCCSFTLLAASVIGVAARGNWIIRSRQKAMAMAEAEVSRSWSKAALREINI